MKTFIFIFLLLICTLSYSQINGVNFQDAEKVETIGLLSLDGAESFETSKIIGQDVYAFTFPVSPAGLRHCIEKIVILLNDNNLSYLEPSMINEAMPDSIDLNNINLDNVYDLNHQLDFDKINNALITIESDNINAVFRMWELKDWQIILILTFDGYQILINQP